MEASDGVGGDVALWTNGCGGVGLIGRLTFLLK